MAFSAERWVRISVFVWYGVLLSRRRRVSDQRCGAGGLDEHGSREPVPQRTYLKPLSDEAKEPIDDTLTKAQALERIDEL
jgi:hypothetical protein